MIMIMKAMAMAMAIVDEHAIDKGKAYTAGA